MPTTTVTPRNDPSIIVDRNTDGVALRVEPVKGEAAGKYAEDLAFLEEEVEVMLQPSMSENDSTRIVGPIVVNGVGLWLERGKWCKIKRKYLGVLLSARTDSWSFSATPTAGGGSRQHEYAVQSGRYPLAGVRDTNPKGAAWLQHLQSNPY